ncbi:MAG: CBS domain-containing protein [Nitrospira sp.]
MSTRAVTVTMDDSLARARELFNEHHFHHLLVVQGPTLLGIISDRDLLKAVSPHIGTLSETDRDRATLNKRAHQIMSRKLITVAADTTVEAAAQLLLEHRVSCLPVVTTAGLLEGIITWRDLLREYLRHTPAGG